MSAAGKAAGAGAGQSPHWAGMQERGALAGLWFMLQAYRLLGRVGFAVFLAPVMAYFFATGRTARDASRGFLARVWSLPDGRRTLGRPPTLFDSFRHFLSFGSAILDKVASWTGDIRLEDVAYENREPFTRLHASGRGGVLIGSHLGNLELCRALGSLQRGLRINVVVHTSHAAAFNRLLARANPDAALNLVQASAFGADTAILLREKIDRGELVVIVGDRTPPSGNGRAVRVPFMGAEASFPEGPFVLAALMECPVLLLFCVRDGRKVRITFETLAEDRLHLPRRDRREHLRAAVARYAARLEHHALRHPLQWFNFFDFWAAPPAPTPNDG